MFGSEFLIGLHGSIIRFPHAVHPHVLCLCPAIVNDDDAPRAKSWEYFLQTSFDRPLEINVE
jgi:hypothetical protein